MDSRAVFPSGGRIRLDGATRGTGKLDSRRRGRTKNVIDEEALDGRELTRWLSFVKGSLGGASTIDPRKIECKRERKVEK